MNNETSWFKSSENQFSSFSWGRDETLHNINLLNDSQNINQAWQVQNPYYQRYNQKNKYRVQLSSNFFVVYYCFEIL